MERRLAYIFLPFALLLPWEALAQGLTEGEITAVMESATVKGGIQSCAAAEPAGTAPKAIDLVMNIGVDGRVQLSGTVPAAGGAFLTCMAAVIQKIKFRATGLVFEVTYPMDLTTPAAAPPGNNVVVLPPGSGTQPQPEPAAGTAAPAQPPPKPVDPFWDHEYRQGRAMVIAGAMLVPLSALSFLGGGFCWMIFGILCLSTDESDMCHASRISGIVALSGLAVLVVGVVILSMGVSKKRRAQKAMQMGGILPEPGFMPLTGGGVGTFGWHF
jgi:hypothetical protein